MFNVYPSEVLRIKSILMQSKTNLRNFIVEYWYIVYVSCIQGLFFKNYVILKFWKNFPKKVTKLVKIYTRKKINLKYSDFFVVEKKKSCQKEALVIYHVDVLINGRLP